MKRKRTTFRDVKVDEILNQKTAKISKDGQDTFFEIGGESTSDVAEAVAILMRKVDWKDPIWQTDVQSGIVYQNLTPEKALFWLTGGNKEWKTLNHYNRPWCDCYLDFQEEFGFMIVNIVKKSKKLSDIRDGFLKYLNLPVLYNFAISKKMIKI